MTNLKTGIVPIVGALIVIACTCAVAKEGVGNKEQNANARHLDQPAEFVKSLLRADMMDSSAVLQPKVAESSHVQLPIRSRSELSKYLTLVSSSESPLSRLSSGARKRFLNGLVFTSHGVGSFPYRELEVELSASEIYQVLRLFGVQENTPYLSGARLDNSVDEMIMSMKPVTLRHYENDMWCENHGDMYWCVPVDGNSCSSACM